MRRRQRSSSSMKRRTPNTSSMRIANSNSNSSSRSSSPFMFRSPNNNNNIYKNIRERQNRLGLVPLDPKKLIAIWKAGPENYRSLKTNERNRLVLFLNSKKTKKPQPRVKIEDEINNLIRLMQV